MSEEPRVVGPGWHAKVFAMVRRVPAGRVATYGQIATRLGSPRVARHVGFALAGSSRSEHDGPVPWYRIVNSRGGISTRDDTGSGLDQRGLLEEEGVEFKSNGTIDLKRYGWQPGSDPA
ncbi:MAG: MGMT family protein [Nannocystaceae bacterium]|nr:MGMT family protein [Nannocystaceae bacterium]